MTVRVAVGAGRGRLMHQLVVENLVVAGLGGLLGVVLAQQGVHAILAMFPAGFPLPRAQEVGIDGRVLAFAAIATMGIGLVVGVAPGLQASRRNLVETLHSAGRSIAASASRFRAILVVAEVSLAVVVVIGAGLMARSLLRLYNVNPGFQVERILTMRMLLQPPQEAPATRPTLAAVLARRAGVVNEMLDRVRAIPGVIETGMTHSLPLGGFGSNSSWSRGDRPEPRPSESPTAEISVITPGYFRTMGVPVTHGRNFDERDRLEASPHAVIVNQALVNQYFPGENPVGKPIKLFWGPSSKFEIVGIVGDTRTGSINGTNTGLRQQPSPIVFVANTQEPSPFVTLVVRTTGDPLASIRSVRERIRAVNPNQGVSDILTMEQVVSDSIANVRLQTVLLGAFAGLALLLASVGLYGVISYSVEQRRREMGIRLALGAMRKSVLGLVLRQGLGLTAIGLAAGLAGALALTRFLESLLYEVQPTDPAVFTAVAVILIATAGLACYLPARRATRVDPAMILRDE
jgi:putative ABC transport system permease protein